MQLPPYLTQHIDKILDKNKNKLKKVIRFWKKLGSKVIIVLEGIPGKTKKSSNAFYYCNGKDAFESFKLKPLEEGVMTGVTATLLLKSSHININCVFVESSTGLPDSEAAAKSIQVMNQHLGLDVDCKPLLSAAKKFEGMLKTAIANKQPQQNMPKYKTEKNDLDYLGQFYDKQIRKRDISG